MLSYYYQLVRDYINIVVLSLLILGGSAYILYSPQGKRRWSAAGAVQQKRVSVSLAARVNNLRCSGTAGFDGRQKLYPHLLWLRA
jgi:hypothetical protein